PAIDRVREGDHFSVRIFLGHRPSLAEGGSMRQQIELKSPILMGGAGGDRSFLAAHALVAQGFGTCLVHDIAREISESGESVEVGANPFSAESRLKQLRASSAGVTGPTMTGLVARTIDTGYDESESLASALERIKREAREAVAAGVTLLILDD